LLRSRRIYLRLHRCLNASQDGVDLLLEPRPDTHAGRFRCCAHRDRKRIIQKLGVQPQGILELNTVFRERGYRKDMGVKGAVAVLFQQRFIKSKKAATSNWANTRLTEAQLVYAANDAYAAIRVFHALGLPG